MSPLFGSQFLGLAVNLPVEPNIGNKLWHGSPLQEAVIKVVAYSSAPTGIVSFALILWGLRMRETDSQR